MIVLLGGGGVAAGVYTAYAMFSFSSILDVISMYHIWHIWRWACSGWDLRSGWVGGIALWEAKAFFSSVNM
jgi:hypothetical protein